ncbi:hypothetical protein [Streptomyces platensis]|uniref:hypothetical protein n=1 Tax=Streptomyces platensis TaxID=58346 RepID=UPI001F16CD6B|nr:hypothetical protein [Streptomyces platensis]MCF3143748.1 hypothetical protein [Streptomyces platensis]
MHTIPLRTPLDDTGLAHHQDQAEQPPAPRLDTSRFNHPNFLGTSRGEREGWIVYSFTPFTGAEDRPQLPAAAYHLPLGWQDREPLARQYEAARILWSYARLRSQAKPLLHEAASRWTDWTEAKAQLTAVFERFWSTGDGQWRAQLLRLVDAERAVTKAADRWDTVAGHLAQIAADQIEVAGREEELPLTTVATELGYDASDWMVRPVGDYCHPLPQYRIVRDGIELWDRATPLAASASKLIEVQRERLREVASLAGDTVHRALA